MKNSIERQYPQCTLPRYSLFNSSTPLFASKSLRNCWIKNDAHINRHYGGNKVRKLEYLIADAKQKGRKDVFAFGFDGSNFATASAIFNQQAGLQAHSMLLPQIEEPYVAVNLARSMQAGANINQRANTAKLAATVIRQYFKLFLKHKARPYFFPAGGSTGVGIVGFVNALLEVAEQWPETKPPEKIYIAMGSMGSAVGLAIGCALLNWDTEIHAVRVIEPKYANAKAARKLTKQCLRVLAKQDINVPKIEQAMARLIIRNEQFGGQYGKVTEAATKALQQANKDGLKLDTTYSAKAYACLLADQANNPSPVIFWNTHNGVDISQPTTI